jgi:hypothetical protein
MWSSYAKAVAFNLSQDLAIEVRRHANGATAVLQVTNAVRAGLVVGISSGNLCAVQGLPVAVAE